MDTDFCRTPTFPSPFFPQRQRHSSSKLKFTKPHTSQAVRVKWRSAPNSQCCRQVNCHGKRGWGSWAAWIWGGKGSGRPYQGTSISDWEGRRRESKTLLSGAQWQDKQWPQTEIQENHWEQKKTPFILLWMIKHWKRLSREAVEPPALELLKTQTRFGPEQPVPADGAPSMGLRSSEAPSSLNYSMIPRCWTETWTQHQNQAVSAITMLDLIWIPIFL